METWAPIPEHSLFECSDDGRVRRVSYGSLRKGPKNPLPFELRNKPTRQGYLDVCVAKDGSAQKWRRVHHLVALTFLGPPPTPDHIVCHKDGDKQNNRADNLYWGTKAENGQDATRHGVWAERSALFEHPTAKLGVAEVRDIKAALKRGETHRVLAELHAVSRSTIAMISAGLNWGWVE